MPFIANDPRQSASDSNKLQAEAGADFGLSLKSTKSQNANRNFYGDDLVFEINETLAIVCIENI